jgi:hypothetical protein
VQRALPLLAAMRCAYDDGDEYPVRTLFACWHADFHVHRRGRQHSAVGIHSQAITSGMAWDDQLPVELFASHDGVVMQPRGDGEAYFAAFVHASDAAAAAPYP